MKIANKKIVVLAAALLLALAAGILYLLVGVKRAPVQILSSAPLNQAKDVGLFDPITIEFDKNLSAKTQPDILYKMEPNIDTQHSWRGDQVLVIQPVPSLAPETGYKLSLFYKDIPIKTIIFTTKNAKDMSPEETARYQAISDMLYSESIEKTYQERPWLANLPIDNDQYTAVYDSEKDSIRVRIKVGPTTTIEQLKAKIITDLIKKGVPQDMNIIWILP